TADGETQESAAVTLPEDNSSTLPRVTFQTPEKPGEESSHRKLGKLTIKYNRKDLQRWLDLEEWINAQLQELYQCRVSPWVFIRYCHLLQHLSDCCVCSQRSLHRYDPTSFKLPGLAPAGGV
uniref:Protein phosphatase 1 regulatory subunit 14D n=1 Tax=Strix occidentalis caurina TaxID=311401 RepID=A0A8D0F6D9_STROC